MLRIHFVSEDLGSFVSPSPDDHIKLFFPPTTDEANVDAQEMRDFTPRLFNVETGTLAIDFALHNHGVATQWASKAQQGDQIEIGGPRGSFVVPDDFDWYILIGDQTAIPSFGRRLEQLRPEAQIITFILIAEDTEIQAFRPRENWAAHWLIRNNRQDDSSLFTSALEQLLLPPGDGFIWVAAETSVASTLYRYLVDDRGHPSEWIKASAYWTREEAHPQ